MENLLLLMGRIAGFAGLLLSAVAAASRIWKVYWLGSFQVGTLLQAGMAAMMAGCFCLLVALAGRLKAGEL